MFQELLIAILVIFIVVAFFVGRSRKPQVSASENIKLQAEIDFLNRECAQLQSDKKNATEREELLRQDNQELIARISIRDTEYHHIKEKLKEQQLETQDLQEKFTTAFENLAHKILEAKSESFVKQNKQSLETLLTPLQEKIVTFEQKVTQTHLESVDYHAALRQQILGLKELNQQMSQETINLTKALKGDNKMQGNWGELILERVLEKSGLEKGREYEVQQHRLAEDGSRMLPDVVLFLPDNRKMIIDSKVSLVAYERYINETDETAKANFLNAHLKSLKQHIEGLADKNYQDLYAGDSPDFVLLFVPIETAFTAAINAEPSLYTKAFDRNIIVVTPSTLLATLRTIDTMWTQRKQQENAFEIARQAGLLYDKFEGLIQDLSKIGKRIDDTKNEYDKAFNKLSHGRGNLISSVQRLKEMGAKAKKSLPETLIQKAEDQE